MITARKKLFAGVIVNAVLVVLEIVATCISVKMDRGGYQWFIFYTEDSNLFCLASALLYLVFSVPVLLGKRESVPLWVHSIRHMATACVTMTFVVVVTVLAPMFAAYGGLAASYRIMLFSELVIYTHFLCPILSALSFLFCEERPLLPFRVNLWALIPTLLYTFIAATLNILRIWTGPYPFLMVYEQSPLASALWFVVMIGGAYLLAWLLWKGNRLLNRSM